MGSASVLIVLPSPNCTPGYLSNQHTPQAKDACQKTVGRQRKGTPCLNSDQRVSTATRRCRHTHSKHASAPTNARSALPVSSASWPTSVPIAGVVLCQDPSDRRTTGKARTSLGGSSGHPGEAQAGGSRSPYQVCRRPQNDPARAALACAAVTAGAQSAAGACGCPESSRRWNAKKCQDSAHAV